MADVTSSLRTLMQATSTLDIEDCIDVAFDLLAAVEPGSKDTHASLWDHSGGLVDIKSDLTVRSLPFALCKIAARVNVYQQTIEYRLETVRANVDSIKRRLFEHIELSN